jgi:hypothetical protein
MWSCSNEGSGKKHLDLPSSSLPSLTSVFHWIVQQKPNSKGSQDRYSTKVCSASLKIVLGKENRWRGDVHLCACLSSLLCDVAGLNRLHLIDWALMGLKVGKEREIYVYNSSPSPNIARS